MTKGNGFTDEHTKATVINADGGRAEWFACTFTYHRLQVVIEKVDGAGVYIAESADEAVFFQGSGKTGDCFCVTRPRFVFLRCAYGRSQGKRFRMRFRSGC